MNDQDKHLFSDKFHLRLPAGSIDRLREQAYSDNRSINNYLVNLILEHLDKKEQQEDE